MIGAHELERAERVLKVVYGGDVGRQLKALEVDREALDSLIEHAWGVLDRHYGQALRSMDPRLRAALNTLLAHAFLTGLIAGRNSEREIT